MPEEEDLQAKLILQRREAIAGGEATNDLDTAINSANHPQKIPNKLHKVRSPLGWVEGRKCAITFGLG